MDQHQRELLVARVVSGVVRLHIYNEYNRQVVVQVRQSSREARYIAQELYQETYEDCLLDGSYSDDELLAWLRTNRIWDDASEARVTVLEKDIEDWKVKMFQSVFQSYERQAAKLNIDAARSEHAALMKRRHGHDHLTAHGMAGMVRLRYLLGTSLYRSDGRSVLAAEDFWDNATATEGSVVFDHAVEAYLESRLPDENLRELARTDPWRSTWSVRGTSASIFGIPAADLTDEQVRLQVWSNLYENISGHPKCPVEEVMNDDDMLDGWLILQRREREADTTQKQADAVVTNEAIRNSDEVFIIAQSREDALKIDSLNSANAARVKRQREKDVEDRGAVQHVDLRDVRMDCRMQAVKERAAALKG